MRLLFEPLTELFTLQDEFDRLLNPYKSNRDGNSYGQAQLPQLDVYENDEAYLVCVDLPGCSKDDVALTLDNKTLTIEAKRQIIHNDKEEHVLRNERSSATLRRVLTFPTAVNGDAIGAQYRNGVLEVRCPKAEEAKPRQIQISE